MLGVGSLRSQGYRRGFTPSPRQLVDGSIRPQPVAVFNGKSAEGEGSAGNPSTLPRLPGAYAASGRSRPIRRLRSSQAATSPMRSIWRWSTCPY